MTIETTRFSLTDEETEELVSHCRTIQRKERPNNETGRKIAEDILKNIKQKESVSPRQANWMKERAENLGIGLPKVLIDVLAKIADEQPQRSLKSGLSNSTDTDEFQTRVISALGRIERRLEELEKLNS